MSTLAEWATRARSQRPNLAPPPERLPLTEGLLIAAGTSLFSFGLSLHLMLDLDIVPADAISRVANAYYVLFSRTPHLGAIGFVWNPLPSLLEIPLTLLHGLWPALTVHGLAGGVVSSLFAGLGAFYLDRLLYRLSLGRALRVLFTALYVLNPMIAYYGANGMSDLMMVSTFLAAWEGAFAYQKEHHLGQLVASALWLGAAFLIRYEAVPFAGLLAIGLGFALYAKRCPTSEIEGALTILLTPVVYASAFWVYLNWLIMKNPLYFLTSDYGNAAQTSTGVFLSPALASAVHHPVGAVLYALQFMLLFWPVAPALLLTLALFLPGPRRDARAPLLVLPMAAVPLLQVMMLYLGKSAGWDRFFITYVPEGFLLVAFLVHKAVSRWQSLAATLAVLTLLSGDVGTLIALQHPTLGHGDSGLVSAALADRRMPSSLAQDQAIAVYVDRHPHMLVLLDTFNFWDVVLSARNPHQFVVTSDLDFQSILHYPAGRVTDFLVPAPVRGMQLDAIDRAYPGIWRHGEPWARLVQTFPGDQEARLYRILPGAPGTP